MSAAYLAATREMGMDEAAALDYAGDWADNAQRQYAYLDAITCSSFNDATVTTYGYGDQARASPVSRRAFRLLPQHSDNAARLAAGDIPERRMHYGGLSDRANGKKRTGGGSDFETLYMPGISIKEIAETGELRLGGGTWPDGSSKREPPKWVFELGVKDRSGSLQKGDRLFGCGTARRNIKVK